MAPLPLCCQGCHYVGFSDHMSRVDGLTERHVSPRAQIGLRVAIIVFSVVFRQQGLLLLLDEEPVVRQRAALTAEVHQTAAVVARGTLKTQDGLRHGLVALDEGGGVFFWKTQHPKTTPGSLTCSNRIPPKALLKCR